MLGVYLHFSSPRHQSQLLFGEQSRNLTGCIPHDTTSKESQKRVTSLRCIKASASYLFSFCFLSNSCIELSLTMAACASCASLMKWFRTLRSQIGLSGVGRLGWVHSNTINRKASNPAIPDAKKGGQRLVEQLGQRTKKQQEQEEPLIRGRVARNER